MNELSCGYTKYNNGQQDSKKRRGNYKYHLIIATFAVDLINQI